jgi:hypothetical protein
MNNEEGKNFFLKKSTTTKNSKDQNCSPSTQEAEAERTQV